MTKESFNFCLSPSTIKNIPFNKYDNDFKFIVNGKEYHAPRIVADLLSPTICKYHFIDPTINEITIKATLQESDADIFNDFLQLITFENKKIDAKHQKYFSEFFYSLRNINEYIRLNLNYEDTLTSENIIHRLKTVSPIVHNLPDTNDQGFTIFREMIDFCSSHFEEIDKDQMSELDINILNEIISNDKLRVNDEDSLLSFVLLLYEKDHQNSILFENVLIANLSEEGLNKFVNAFDVEDINQAIWSRVCAKLVCKEDKKCENENRYIHPGPKKNSNIQTFEFEEGKEFNGIMRYLTNKTGGNIHDNKTIEITSNSINTNGQMPNNVVDFSNDDSHYCSNKGDNSFICFNFKEKSVQLIGYSIKSRTDGHENYTNLKNWVIEVSNNGSDWLEIDRHSNDSSQNGRGKISIFSIQKPQTEFYHFIRLRQTGESWYKTNNKFGLTYIEFFGKLQESP